MTSNSYVFPTVGGINLGPPRHARCSKQTNYTTRNLVRVPYYLVRGIRVTLASNHLIQRH